MVMILKVFHCAAQSPYEPHEQLQVIVVLILLFVPEVIPFWEGHIDYPVVFESPVEVVQAY